MAENKVKIIKYTLTRLLAGREHSQHELLNKLLQRDFERALCLEWIEKYRQHNLQSDERFTESLIRGRSNKGIGENRIRNELREHQIDPDLIEFVLRELDIDWFELAAKVYHKKYPFPKSDDYKVRQKQQRFMYYRGFTQEQINYAIESSDNLA